MGLKNIYSIIENRLHTIEDEYGIEIFKHYHTWNSQFKDLLGSAGSNKDVSIPFPAVFMEVVVDKIEEQGSFNQNLECTLNLHIAHQLMNSMFGEFEQNWEIFDLVDQVHKSFQGFHPTLFGTFIRKGMKQDYSHGNLYHFILTYKFTYEDIYNLNLIQHTGTALNIQSIILTGGTYTTQINK